jgi:inward rectifier potassium channel
MPSAIQGSPVDRPRVKRGRQAQDTRGRLDRVVVSKTGVRRYDLSDPYHLAVALTWPQFLLALLALDMAINFLFAVLYVAVPGSVANARPGSLADAFFFSLETLATVGYGVMAPASLYGHVVASAETVCGVAFTAIMTGLMFVRFSRPKAKIIYADQAVVASHNGRPTLMVRIANGRFNILTNAFAQLIVLQAERSAEGVFFRRVHELRLVRTTFPIFPLAWTIMHELDEQSPLYGLGPAELASTDIQLFLSVEAHDPVLGATVHAVKPYRTADILFGMRYADAFDEKTSLLDLTRISQIEPDIGVPIEQRV